MKIGGVQKFSLVDYPGKISTVVFTQGCNYRCRYCHNPELVIPEQFNEPIPEEEVLCFLEKRKGQLEGVVITGGEPTIQADITPFVQKIKILGFAVKLDTNGSNPHVLKRLLDLNLIDYIAMDIKAPFEKYDLLAGTEVYIDKVKESIEIIKNSGVSYHFRTTFVQSLLDRHDVHKIINCVPKATHILQDFVPRDKMIDHTLSV